MKILIVSFGMFLLSFAEPAFSSDELLAVATQEQEAFEDGDCETVEALMAEEITFYANSRRMSREQVGNFCRSIKRPFGAGRSPIEDTTTPYLMSDTLGYTIRDFRWQGEKGRIVHEVVTKIWSRDESGWKMVHFQSTVMPEQGKKQPR